ncbi:MAG TPA: hypothetical protein QGH10_20500 [Armatimonadota bacterium]|nr:hypothetical protein [Armatimonadota bacterium]
MGSIIAACVMVVGSMAGADELGPVGAAHVSFDPARGLSGIEATVNGVTFRPLDGAGDGLDVDAEVQDDVLVLTVTSDAPVTEGIDAGVATGLGEWRRLDLSRYAEPYGQRWWPKTVYSVDGDFWFTAHWVMEQSSGTKWVATDEHNHGTDPFPAALNVEYSPDTDGKYLPIHEVLELRFSRDLWDVVPEVKQGPSEYRDFLNQAVFVDLWGNEPIAETRHFLEVLKRVGGDRVPFYTILQSWSCAGWDALLPDSMWLPDYPPGIGVGTVDEIREVCELGKSMGRFGFRTNYRILREVSPSYRRGLAHYAVDSEANRLDYLRPADWLPVARRADTEIRYTWAPNACFTDQMTSSASPWLWHDYAAKGGSRSMRETMSHQKALARTMKRTFGGPLGSESLSDQHMLGEFVDTGDYAVHNGHSRLVSPEYKLRRLHELSGFHGMGLMYRFYEMPPYDAFHKSMTTFNDDHAQLDDYRAMQIIYGNGGYICRGFANWRYYLTELLLVGHLQPHYSGQSVADVRYWHEGAWVDLERMVEGGSVPSTLAWAEPTKAFERIWVTYENGLHVMVNRSDDPMDSGDGITLPKAGWIVWNDDQTVRAYSAYPPRTEHRVDFLSDDEAKIQYIDPRGEEIPGATEPTLWIDGEIVLTADPNAGTVTIDGETIALDLPKPKPLTEIDFTFDTDIEGWRPVRGMRSAESVNGKLAIDVVAPGTYMHSPPLRVDASAVSAVEIRMRVVAEGAKPSGLYFTTEEAPNVWSDKLQNFDVTADGEWATYRLELGEHPLWQGQTITGLRLDPVRGAAEATIEIDTIRGVQ